LSPSDYNLLLLCDKDKDIGIEVLSSLAPSPPTPARTPNSPLSESFDQENWGALDNTRKRNQSGNQCQPPRLGKAENQFERPQHIRTTFQVSASDFIITYTYHTLGV